jgi:hypothetical protein
VSEFTRFWRVLVFFVPCKRGRPAAQQPAPAGRLPEIPDVPGYRPAAQIVVFTNFFFLDPKFFPIERHFAALSTTSKIISQVVFASFAIGC